MIPEKTLLKNELLAKVGAELEMLERAHQATKEAATHEEAKPENDKDTRALEQSYLARGQALRVEEMRNGLAALMAMNIRDFSNKPVALGALVQIEEEDKTRCLFVAPSGGGTVLADGKIHVVTSQSPLGRSLLGKREGDECELLVSGKNREISIVRVW